MSRSLDFSVRLKAVRNRLPRRAGTGGFSQPTFYIWKKKFGAMGEAEVKRLRELEKENGRLKRLLAERDLELDVIKEFLQKK
jgi:putative transposase